MSLGSVCLHCLSPAQLSSIQFTSALFCSVQIDRKRSEERQPHAVPRPARTCPRRCCTALRLQQMESPAPPSKTQKQERLKVERVREKNESHSNWKSADVPSGGWRARSCHAHASWPGVLAKVRGMVPCWGALHLPPAFLSLRRRALCTCHAWCFPVWRPGRDWLCGPRSSWHEPVVRAQPMLLPSGVAFSAPGRLRFSHVSFEPFGTPLHCFGGLTPSFRKCSSILERQELLRLRTMANVCFCSALTKFWMF